MRFLMAALVLALAPVANAQQPDANGFYRYTTEQGCYFLSDIPPGDFVTGYVWQGSCQQGAPVSGFGTLIAKQDSYVTDDGDRIVNASRETGNWTNGHRNGRFRKESVDSVNGGPWTQIPDDCGESWCRTIHFTYTMGVVDYDSAVWGNVDTYAGTAPPASPARTPVGGGATPVGAGGSPVSGGVQALANSTVLKNISLADIEQLIRDAGFAPSPSSLNPGFLQAVHPNGIRFLASGLVCSDTQKVSGCAGLNLRIEISVKTMKTVLQFPDEQVTWEAINAANANLNMATVFFDETKDAVIIKRVLLVGAGGQTVETLKSEIAEFPVSGKAVIDRYIWPKG